MAHLVIWALSATLLLCPTAGQEPAQEPPLTLSAAIRLALDHSPELAFEDDAVRLAGIGERLAGSDFAIKFSPTIAGGTDPVAGANRTVGLNISKRLSTGATVFGNVSSYQFGPANRDAGYTVGISQPLLRGFSRTALSNREAAARRMDGAMRARDAARAALVVRVSRLYFDVVKHHRLKDAADRAADRAAALRESSEARTHVGLATELDVLRARILESQAAAARTEGRRGLAAATDQLAIVIGRPLGSPLRIDSDVAPLAAADTLDDLPGSIDELVSIALAERLDLIDARAKAAESRRLANVARWNLLPPIAMDISYTQRGLAGATSAFANAFDGWHVGVSSSYSFDRASDTAAIDTAAVSVDAAERAVAQLEQRAAAEVRALYSSWEAAAATITIQQGAVRLAEQERDLAQLRYERGLASSLDVVGAETSLLQAQTALIAAELDRKVFALDVRRAVGRLDVEQIK